MTTKSDREEILFNPHDIAKSFIEVRMSGGTVLSEPMIKELAGRVRFTVGLAEPLPLLPAQSRRSGAGDALPLGPGA